MSGRTGTSADKATFEEVLKDIGVIMFILDDGRTAWGQPPIDACMQGPAPITICSAEELIRVSLDANYEALRMRDPIPLAPNEAVVAETVVAAMNAVSKKMPRGGRMWITLVGARDGGPPLIQATPERAVLAPEASGERA